MQARDITTQICRRLKRFHIFSIYTLKRNNKVQFRQKHEIAKTLKNKNKMFFNFTNFVPNMAIQMGTPHLFPLAGNSSSDASICILWLRYLMGIPLQESQIENVYQNHGGQHIHGHGANEGQENRGRCSCLMCPKNHLLIFPKCPYMNGGVH